jgi:hypothetical protein
MRIEVLERGAAAGSGIATSEVEQRVRRAFGWAPARVRSVSVWLESARAEGLGPSRCQIALTLRA